MKPRMKWHEGALQRSLGALSALCALGVTVATLAWMRHPAGPLASPDSVTVTPLRCPFEQALWEARGWRLRALTEVNSEREAMEEWDPDAIEGPASGSAAIEGWRLQQMASDRGGHLLRARQAAQRAAALAQTPAEAYRAAEHLARIEHEAGRHDVELKQARRLMTLAPGNPLSQITLRRALTCTGRDALPQAPSLSRRRKNE